MYGISVCKFFTAVQGDIEKMFITSWHMVVFYDKMGCAYECFMINSGHVCKLFTS